MIILTLETEHFHFEAAGDTEQEAEDALVHALRYHGEAYSLEKEWWVGAYDVEKRVINAGECHRDGQLLYRKN